MKKVISDPRYLCEICGYSYSTEEQALVCEARGRLMDKGAKVGDRVRITRGAGTGCEAIVTNILVYDPSWGHYAADRYAHTVGLIADVIGLPGCRQLTFDDYEVC